MKQLLPPANSHSVCHATVIRFLRILPLCCCYWCSNYTARSKYIRWGELRKFLITSLITCAKYIADSNFRKIRVRHWEQNKFGVRKYFVANVLLLEASSLYIGFFRSFRHKFCFTLSKKKCDYTFCFIADPVWKFPRTLSRVRNQGI